MAELVELIEGEPASPQGSKLQSDLDVLDRRTIQLPPESPSNLQPILAVVLQGAVIAFLIISLCVDIYIRRPGSLSTADHLLYVTGITILATLITGHATGQIRRLWVYNLTSKVRGTHGLVSQARKRITLLVGLGMFLDSFKYWRISVSFLIVGLVTTSIVAGLTPTTVPGKNSFPLSHRRELTARSQGAGPSKSIFKPLFWSLWSMSNKRTERHRQREFFVFVEAIRRLDTERQHDRGSMV